jgi:hypothetical protein
VAMHELRQHSEQERGAAEAAGPPPPPRAGGPRSPPAPASRLPAAQAGPIEEAGQPGPGPPAGEAWPRTRRGRAPRRPGRNTAASRPTGPSPTSRCRRASRPLLQAPCPSIGRLRGGAAAKPARPAHLACSGMQAVRGRLASGPWGGRHGPAAGGGPLAAGRADLAAGLGPGRPAAAGYAPVAAVEVLLAAGHRVAGRLRRRYAGRQEGQGEEQRQGQGADHGTPPGGGHGGCRQGTSSDISRTPSLRINRRCTRRAGGGQAAQRSRFPPSPCVASPGTHSSRLLSFQRGAPVSVTSAT